MNKQHYKSVQSFLENNIKQVIFASLAELNYLQKKFGKTEIQDINEQIERIQKNMANCLHDIDQYILTK